MVIAEELATTENKAVIDKLQKAMSDVSELLMLMTSTVWKKMS